MQIIWIELIKPSRRGIVIALQVVVFATILNVAIQEGFAYLAGRTYHIRFPESFMLTFAAAYGALCTAIGINVLQGWRHIIVFVLGASALVAAMMVIGL